MLSYSVGGLRGVKEGHNEQLNHRKASVFGSLAWRKNGSNSCIFAAFSSVQAKCAPSSRTGRILFLDVEGHKSFLTAEREPSAPTRMSPDAEVPSSKCAVTPTPSGDELVDSILFDHYKPCQQAVIKPDTMNERRTLTSSSLIKSLLKPSLFTLIRRLGGTLYRS